MKLNNEIKFLVYHIVQNSVWGKTFGKFDKTKAISQSFTSQMYIFKNVDNQLLRKNSQDENRLGMRSMSILKYFHPVKQKPYLPDPSCSVI